jgi:superfamily II DNA/RNA helicase
MFLHNPQRVEVARPASTAATIVQRLVATGSEGHEKRDRLRRLIRGEAELNNGLIFCNRKRDVALLQKSLASHGFNVAALHGDMDQRARTVALDGFRSGEVPLLVASDVAARGLDIPAVSHVFNFDVPHHPEDYVHRIGRTGRAGRAGHAFTLVGRGDDRSLQAIETLIGQPIPWLDGDLSAVSESGEAEGETRTRHRGRSTRGTGESTRRPRGRTGSGEGRASEGRGGEARGGESRGSEARGSEARGGEGRGGGGRSGASARRAAPERTRSEEVEAAPPRADAPVSAAPVAPAPSRPRPERGEDRRQDRAPRGRHRDEEDGDTPVGLGGHVPAFLLRPAVVKKRK